MKHNIWLSAIFIFLLFNSTANALTEKYRLSYRDDPSTTIVIGWSGANAVVYYGTDDHGTDWQSYPLNHAVDRSESHRGLTHHFSRLSNLQPGTVYYFVIKDYAGDISQRFSFRTISDNPDDAISFIAGGDSRQGTWPAENCDCRGARQDGNTLVSKVRPDFIAFNGDYVRNLNIPFVSDGDEEWQEWLDDWQLTIASDGRMFPVLPSVGNHETDEDVYKIFDVPEDIYYAINFGGNLFRLYSLNSETDAGSDIIQRAWFENDLQQYNTPSNTPFWKFVQYHIPMIPQAQYDPREDLIEHWAPYFPQYGVRMVMESHTHVVKVTWPVVASDDPDNYNGFIQDDSLGAVFTGGGTWGAPLRTPYAQFPITRAVTATNSFFFNRVTKDSVTIETVLFLNVDDVTELTDDEQGSFLPSDASVWNPAAGSVVVITNNSTVSSTAALQQTNKNASIIMPNPAKSVVTLQFEELPKEAFTIEIYNAWGQKCQSIPNIQDQTYQLDVSGLCPGVNYINIITEDDVESHKLIITE